MKRNRLLTFVLVLLILLSGPLARNGGSALAAPLKQTLKPVPSALELAVNSIGGKDALTGLKTITVQGAGTRWTFDESYQVELRAARTGAFTETVSYDLAGNKLRLDYVRQGLNSNRKITEVTAANLGYVAGQDANFGPPANKVMTSDRWASTLKQQRLLNPHLILRDILANPGIAKDGGEALLDGSVHHLLVVSDTVAPMTLYVNAATGQIAKLATMENDHLRRDVMLDVFYYHWQPVGDGLFFPTELYIAVDGQITHKEIRTAITVNQPLASDLFAFPKDVSPVFDKELATWGEFNSQFYQMFDALGFPRAGTQTKVEAKELAPGVFHLTGGTHNTLVVEQAKGVVVIETPLQELRSAAILDWIKQKFSNKPITHAIITHHHTDHTSGLRSFVAAGATAVVHAKAADFFAKIFQASSKIQPDDLELHPVAAKIDTVPADGKYQIDDATNPITVYPIANTHAEDMVIIYVGGGRVLFVTDLYSPAANADPGAGGKLINQAITDRSLDVATIAGGHGGTIAFADFQALLKK